MVNLNKKNKKEKDAAFHRRASNLGRGKHQQLSHTKINFKTTQIKMPIQGQLQGDGEQPPTVNEITIQQLQNLLNMCHSENEKHIQSGLSGLLQIFTKSPELIVDHISEVLSGTVHLLRNGDPKVRDLSKNLISRLFSRNGPEISPYIPVLIRHVSASIAFIQPVIQEQAAFLLKKISTLPNLLPSADLFEVFSPMIRAATSPKTFSLYARSIISILKRFSTSSRQLPDSNPTSAFPKLFYHDGLYSARFNPLCQLSINEIRAVDHLISELRNSLVHVGGGDKGEGGAESLVDLCTLLTSLIYLDPPLDLSDFINFVGNHFPLESAELSQNIILARFISRDIDYHPAIKTFLEGLTPSPEIAILAAGVASSPDDFSPFSGLEQINGAKEYITGLIGATISPSAAPEIAKIILSYVEHSSDLPTKRMIRTLIHLNKDEDFQPILANVFVGKIAEFAEKKPSIKELMLQLIASCAPLTPEFLKPIVLYITQDVVDLKLCEDVIDCISITNGRTPANCLLSFLMSTGNRREEVKGRCRMQILRLQKLASIEEAPLFASIDLENFSVHQ